MKSSWKLKDWLAEAAAKKVDFDTIHFDRIEDYRFSGQCGLDMVRLSCQMLAAAGDFIGGLRADGRAKTLVIYLPIQESDTMLMWSPDLWNGVGRSDEPPALYLIRYSQIFDEYSEEYRRPISLPVDSRPGLRAIFRSFRNEEALANSWEFSSGIYMIAGLE